MNYLLSINIGQDSKDRLTRFLDDARWRIDFNSFYEQPAETSCLIRYNVEGKDSLIIKNHIISVKNLDRLSCVLSGRWKYFGDLRKLSGGFRRN